MRARTWIAVGLAPVAALTIGLVAPAGAATVSTFADFEGSDTDAPAGFYAYGGGGGGAGYGVEVIPDTDPLARPGQVGDNNVLSVGADVPGGAYAGFGQNFTTLTDLSAFDGLQLWMYGTNSGAVLQSELLDGKNPAASTASAERWDTEIVDSWTGWRLVQLPWAAYTPATDFPDAPDNGVLDTDSIWGFIFPVVSTTGPVTWKIDDIGVYSGGTVTPTVSVSPTGSVDEGDVAAITVSLNIAPTTPVTVDWATADGTATAGSDYTAASGSVTFAAGETSKTVSVTTLDDTDFEGNETFTVLLSGAVGANLGNAIQTVTLRDDEMAPVVAVWDNVRPVDGFDYSGAVPTGLDPDGNVVGFELFTDPGASAAVSAEVPPSPLPGHDATDTALRIDLSAPSYAGVTSKLTDAAVTDWIPQDWSRYGGLSFWLYGQNTGRSLFVDILDNRNAGATTDDAGRFSVAFTDDVLGWRYVELPFSTFVRKDVGNGAPNDGLTLSQMHGWAFGVTAAPEPNTWYIDDVALTVPETVVDEYEYATLPSGTDPDGIGLGFQPYNGPGASVTVAPLTDARTGAAPGADATNTALSVTLDVPGGSWGGVSYAFDDAGSWGSQDWSGSQGVSFWFYGQGTGDTLYVDLVDNRPEGSVTDNAGRHSASLVDDVLGWRFVELQWSDFAEKNIGNGAPSDGLTLTEIRGYAFGVVTTSGPREYLLDRFALWGDSLKDEPLLVGFDRATYTAAEGDVAEVIVTLSRVSDVPVTVDYTTVDSGARTQTEDGRAVEGVDYVPTSGTLTFAPGQTRTTFTVTLPQDDKHELDKTVQLQLSGVSGGVATLSGFTRGASISITDDDARDPLLVEDFEDTPGLWRTTGGELTDVRIASTDPGAYPARSAGAATARFAVSAAYPGQSADEGVGQFTVSGDGATLTRPFAQPQDWSGQEGLTFWYRGTGSGEQVTVGLHDDAAPDPGPSGWTEVTFRESFDGPAGTAPDPVSWTNETGGWGWGNAESQYYTDGDNVATDGLGNLEIQVRPNSDPALWCSGFGAPCDYTSARIATQGKQEFLYGHIEARVKVPAGEGLWPAFWTLGNDFLDVGWPQTGEIDVMEHVEGANGAPNEAFGTVHGPGYAGGQSIGDKITIAEPFSDDFHTFAVDWEPERITWTMDGIVYHQVTPADLPGPWVFDHPFFLIANMAIGGNFGGAIDPGLTLPASYLIDYIEVRQAPDTAERFEATFVDDVAGWQQVTVPFSTFARSTDQPTGAPDNGLTLSAVHGLAFELGGSAGAGDTVLLDAIRIGPAPTDTPAGPPDTGAPGSPGSTAGPGAPGTDQGAGQGAQPTAGGAGSPEALGDTGTGVWAAMIAVVLVLLGTGLTASARQRRPEPAQTSTR